MASLTESDVKQFATTKLGLDVLKIEVPENGGDSTSFEITTPRGTFFFRTGGMRANYDLEHHILELARSKGILAPEPVSESIDTTKTSFTFSLEKKIEGIDLYQTDKSLWPGILTEVGRQLKILHGIKLSGFGELDTYHFRQTGELKGQDDSWYDFFAKRIGGPIVEVKRKLEAERIKGFKDSKLSTDQRRQVEEIAGRLPEVEARLESLRPRLNGVESALLHDDISFEHILVADGKLSGIIDFNHVSAGDPLFDIAYFSVMPNGNDYCKYLLSGSGAYFDQSLFDIYRLAVAVAKIHTRYVRHNYLHEYPEILEIALGELNKK